MGVGWWVMEKMDRSRVREQADRLRDRYNEIAAGQHTIADALDQLHAAAREQVRRMESPELAADPLAFREQIELGCRETADLVELLRRLAHDQAGRMTALVAPIILIQRQCEGET